MALKSKKKEKSSKKGSRFVTGLDLNDLKKQLASSGGGGNADPEMIYLRGGDIIKVTFVAPIKKWVTFKQHYVGKNAGYRICEGEGCQWCDDGIFASQRTLIGIYVHEHYQAARGQFSAKTTKKVGYRYMVISKDTCESLLTRAKRRNGKLNDYIYIIERDGDDTNTKYDIERDDSKTSEKILKGWPKMDIMGKMEELAERESKRAVKDDDDYDEDEDEDDFDFEDDYDEDEDELPRKKKSSKSSSKSSGTKKKSSKKRR